MPVLLDYLYVVYFAAIGVLIDYLIFWPKFRRRSQVDPIRTRMWAWRWTMVGAWGVVIVGALLWTMHGRSWSSFGFSPPTGWRLWASLALVLVMVGYQVVSAVALVRSADERAKVGAQIGSLTTIVPHTRRELYWFSGVSLTAGFCEEFQFRGYFIWVMSPWLGWWGAAALSLVCFAVGHLYQGWSGVLKTGIVGGLLTLVVAIFDSLWPAIVLHALVDVGSGIMTWLVLRETPSADGLTSAQAG